jgi:hypothetical protein
VQQLETGATSRPNAVYRSILVKLCGRPAVELGFTPPRLSALNYARDSKKASERVKIPLRDAIWVNKLELAEFPARWE